MEAGGELTRAGAQVRDGRNRSRRTAVSTQGTQTASSALNVDPCPPRPARRGPRPPLRAPARHASCAKAPFPSHAGARGRLVSGSVDGTIRVWCAPACPPARAPARPPARPPAPRRGADCARARAAGRRRTPRASASCTGTATGCAPPPPPLLALPLTRPYPPAKPRTVTATGYARPAPPAPAAARGGVSSLAVAGAAVSGAMPALCRRRAARLGLRRRLHQGPPRRPPAALARAGAEARGV